jgi:tight adherence protein C
MQAIALFEYPEFILAMLLGFLVLFKLRREQEQQQNHHVPAWLAQPAKAFLSLSPNSYLSWINKQLLQANWRSELSFGDFSSFKIYVPLLSLFFVLLLPLYAVCIIAIASFFLPDLILFLCVKHRQQEIRQSLPQALDLMVLCVDAGLGLDATLQKVSTEGAGIKKALNEELNILEHEILLGIDRERAYQELYNRTGVDELKTLGSALNQAGKLGLSVVRILRAQSDFIRKRQSQKAEEKAMKMPIYMAFPLWFFIMPSLMLLVLAPSLIKFYHQLHGAS